MTASLQGLRRALERRMSTSDSEQGVALLSVILFMIMLSGMSLVLLGIILGQIGPGYVAQKGTQTVYAAQGGLQSGLAAMRAATKVVTGGEVVGDISKLPCEVKAQLDGTADSPTYRVEINYYLDDPTGRSESWLDSLSNKLSCTTGSGVSTQPNFAYLVSSGSDASAAGRDPDEGNRSVAAIYKFKVTNVNIAGGRIFDFDMNRCFQAQNTTAGSEIRFVTNCSSNDDRQLWVYDTDWHIKLASSIVNAGDVGLCISSEGSGDDAELRECDSGDYRQLWNWMGDSSWHGRNSANNGNSKCLHRDGNDLEVSNSCTTLSPEPAAGAGAASYATHQVVNYQEFGRCLDVTDTDINKNFMISYPCKQDPSGANSFLWNHKWFYSEPDVDGGQTTLHDQQIRVYHNNQTNAANTYCLRTPNESGSSKYPVFTRCTNGGDNIEWTRVYNTGTYANSYLFIDTYGRCLAADENDKYNSNWSRITVESCNGSELQKWNAPASYNAAEFGGFKEMAEYQDLSP